MKRALILVSLLALAPSLMAQNAPAGMTSAEARRAEAYFHFSMARVLDQDQDWDESIKEYRKALEINPNDADIYSAMARTYLNQRNREEAIKAAQKAVEISPDSLGAHKLLGDIYIGTIQSLQGGRQVSPATLKETFDRAIHEFEEIVRIDPTSREGYLMLGQLYRINDDGTNLRRVIDEGGDAENPSWSPTGNFLAFAWKKSGNSRFDIYLHDLVTGKNTQLTQNASDNEKPTWSPDGKHIAFESNRTGTLQIYSMLADGSKPRQLTRTGSNKAPAWSGYIK